MTALKTTALALSLAVALALGARFGLADPPTTQPAMGVGVTYTTPSGLKIMCTARGTGAQDGDEVLVNYSGKLTDGLEFDSSYKAGVPLKFTLGQSQVIKGWEEGIRGMQIGEKRVLTIPPDLGYGERGSGPIPPNATLIFNIELVGIHRG